VFFKSSAIPFKEKTKLPITTDDEGFKGTP
jgi:hypothetical protein